MSKVRFASSIWIRSFSTTGLTDVGIKALAKWKVHYREPLNAIMKSILNDKSYRTTINSKYIDHMNWSIFVNTFRRNLIKEPLQHLQMNALLDMMEHINAYAHASENNHNPTIEPKDCKACKDFIFGLAFDKALVEMETTIQINQALSKTFDSRLPHEWYPHTRIMKRKIFYHGGPTNSGKTYQAIQRLKQANSAYGGGLYCGPLRLLAIEIYDLLNKQGIATDLLTGQEKRFVPGSSHISCTIEMLSVTRSYDVAVIDEIQMIADSERGHAWTKALLGVQAREIHVCGGKEARQLVESLCNTTGDDFEFISYDRLSTLQVEEESLRGDYTKVRPGDCIVAFSVAELFSIRNEIEKLTNYKCAVIYGKLPPETRSTQARLFNDENSGYDILVASDAIGMGLNLNIGRIIFHTVFKRSNSHVRSLYMHPSHVKQIAGRAGRKSSKYAIGKVTAWQERDLAYVKAVMNWDIPQITAAGLFPPPEQIQSFHDKVMKAMETGSAEVVSSSSIVTPPSSSSSTTPVALESSVDDDKALEEIPVVEEIPLSSIVERFVELSRVDDRFFMCNYDQIVLTCNWLHTVPLTVIDRLTFANAPVNYNDILTMNTLYRYAAAYAVGRPVVLGVHLPRQLPTGVLDFGDLCAKHNIIDMYLWLSLRFPKLFIERDHALVVKETVVSMIEESLSSLLRSEKSFRTAYLGTIRTLNRLATKREPVLLPPIEYGTSIREDMKKYLNQVPDASWYIDPHYPVNKEEDDLNDSESYEEQRV